MWQLILGPIFGTFGGLLQKWLDAKEKAADRAHELAVMEKEYVLAERKMAIEASIRESEADARVFEASYQFANDRLLPEGSKLSSGQKWLALAIDAFTRLIRPASTVFYQVAVAGVFVWAAVELSRRGVDAVTTEALGKIVGEIIFSIIGMAETTLFWWFGIRGMSRKR